MTENGNSPLDELPFVYIRVQDGKNWVFAMVDGDYDGEYFAQFKWRLINGYVFRTEPTDRFKVSRKGYKYRSNKMIYLHQQVLPPKPGRWTHFKDGNHLNCRSSNLEYVSPKEVSYFSIKSRRLRDGRNSSGWETGRKN